MMETAVPAANEAVSTATSVTAATPQAALDALLCDILPRQGCWSDEAYLWLTDHSRRLIEFTDGRVEELPMPTFTHQGPFWRSSIACSTTIYGRVAVLRCFRGCGCAFGRGSSGSRTC